MGGDLHVVGRVIPVRPAVFHAIGGVLPVRLAFVGDVVLLFLRSPIPWRGVIQWPVPRRGVDQDAKPPSASGDEEDCRVAILGHGFVPLGRRCYRCR